MNRIWLPLLVLAILVSCAKSSPPTPNYTINVSGDGNETISPDTKQSVAQGSGLALTVTGASNFGVNNTVGGTCPAGSWNGAVYTTGAVTAACTVSFAASQIYTLVHSFSGNAADGNNPRGGLVEVGGILYGTTNIGGAASVGTLYSLDPTDSDFNVVRSFTNSTSDAFHPTGNLINVSGALVGVSGFGGSSGQGTVFSVGTDNSGFTILQPFNVTNGQGPVGGVTLSGSTFYGVASGGGANSKGVVYSVGQTGSAYTVLHAFTGGSGDGQMPVGKLNVAGSALFGMTELGGSGKGVIFTMGTNGSNFAVLHSFAGGASDGETPNAGLLQVGSQFYGMTLAGGTSNLGTIFRINNDGSAFTILHSFQGVPNEGAQPEGALIISGSTLYGVTGAGGGTGYGTLFSMSTDGTNYQTLHSFGGPTTDAGTPWADLYLYGKTLYGTTEGGGANSDGAIFSYLLPPY